MTERLNIFRILEKGKNLSLFPVAACQSDHNLNLYLVLPEQKESPNLAQTRECPPF